MHVAPFGGRGPQPVPLRRTIQNAVRGALFSCCDRLAAGPGVLLSLKLLNLKKNKIKKYGILALTQGSDDFFKSHFLRVAFFGVLSYFLFW